MNRESAEKILTTWIPLTLRGGAVLACVFLLVGMTIELFLGSTIEASHEALLAGADVTFTFADYPLQLIGLCILLLTPVVRLILAIWHFVLLRDFRMAVFASTSLGLIVFGFVFWRMTGS